MINIPTHLLRTFFKIVAYHPKIALHVNDQNTSIENCQNRKCSVHGAIGQGFPKKKSDVMNPMELTGFPSKIIFLGYGDFYLSSKGHSGTPTNFN